MRAMQDQALLGQTGPEGTVARRSVVRRSLVLDVPESQLINDWYDL